MLSKTTIFLTLFSLLFALTACSSNDSDAPALAVESYFQALAARDANQLINASCADWEENARNELRSFDANSISVEDMNCQVDNLDGPSAQVSCTGKIIANYGNEVLEIDLANRKYQAVNEGGDWRMCGYR